MIKILIYIIFIISSIGAFSQKNAFKNIPATGKDIFVFIPEGYDTLQTAWGDLNKDGKEDAVLALHAKEMEDQIGVTINDEDVPQRFLLILLKSNNGFTLSAKSDKAIMCRSCGGIFGDPFSEISIKNNVLSISHYGGSAWRWSYVHKFRLQNNNWLLIGRSKLWYWNVAYCDKLGEFAATEEEDENLLTGEFIKKEISQEGCKVLVDKKGKRKVKPLLSLNKFDISK